MLLLFIYHLPSDIKSSFVFYRNNPLDIISVFMSNYTHEDAKHLLDNLSLYLLLLLLIFAIDKDMDLLARSSAVFLILVPFVLTLLIFVMTPIISNLGFSGIVAAFYGYFVFAVWRGLKRIDDKVDFNILALMLLLNIFLVVYINSDYIPWGTWLVWVLVIAFVVGFAVQTDKISSIADKICKIMFELVKRRDVSSFVYYLIISLIIMLVFLFYLPFIVDFRSIPNGINVFAHYVGYVLGIIVPLVFYVKYPPQK